MKQKIEIKNPTINDWNYYHAMELLELWKLVLLSFNLCPKFYCYESGRICNLPKIFEERVSNRLEIASTHLKIGKLKNAKTNQRGITYPKGLKLLLLAAEASKITGPLTRNIYLKDFIEWAKSCKFPISNLMISSKILKEKSKQPNNDKEITHSTIARKTVNIRHEKNRPEKERALKLFKEKKWKSVSEASRAIAPKLTKKTKDRDDTFKVNTVRDWLYNLEDHEQWIA